MKKRNQLAVIGILTMSASLAGAQREATFKVSAEGSKAKITFTLEGDEWAQDVAALAPLWGYQSTVPAPNPEDLPIPNPESEEDFVARHWEDWFLEKADGLAATEVGEEAEDQHRNENADRKGKPE